MANSLDPSLKSLCPDNPLCRPDEHLLLAESHVHTPTVASGSKRQQDSSTISRQYTGLHLILLQIRRARLLHQLQSNKPLNLCLVSSETITTNSQVCMPHNQRRY